MSSCAYSPANLNSLTAASAPIRRMVPGQYLPRMAPSSAPRMAPSGARRGLDLTQTGIQSYSVLPNAPVDNEFTSQFDVTSSCLDCSNVDQATFNKECVRDRNVGYASLRFAQCGLKANRQINQDNGSRQTDKLDQRESLAYNLTNPSANQKYTTEVMAPSSASTMSSRDPLGSVTPATPLFGAYPLSAL
jgi:hypothetical protein